MVTSGGLGALDAAASACAMRVERGVDVLKDLVFEGTNTEFEFRRIGNNVIARAAADRADRDDGHLSGCNLA